MPIDVFLTEDEICHLIACVDTQIRHHYCRLGKAETSGSDIDWNKKEIAELERIRNILKRVSEIAREKR